MMRAPAADIFLSTKLHDVFLCFLFPPRPAHHPAHHYLFLETKHRRPDLLEAVVRPVNSVTFTTQRRDEGQSSLELQQEGVFLAAGTAGMLRGEGEQCSMRSLVSTILHFLGQNRA